MMQTVVALVPLGANEGNNRTNRVCICFAKDLKGGKRGRREQWMAFPPRFTSSQYTAHSCNKHRHIP